MLAGNDLCRTLLGLEAYLSTRSLTIPKMTNEIDALRSHPLVGQLAAELWK